MHGWHWHMWYGGRSEGIQDFWFSKKTVKKYIYIWLVDVFGGATPSSKGWKAAGIPPKLRSYYGKQMY